MLKHWSQQDFETALRAHASGWSAAQIGRQIGRSEAGVRLKLIASGYSSAHLGESKALDAPAPTPPPATQPLEPTPLEESNTGTDADRLLENRDRLIEVRKTRQSALEEAQQERLMRILREILLECRLDISIAAPPVPEPCSHPHSAVLLVGDWHLGKECNALETEGRATYSVALAAARLHYLEMEVSRLLAQGPKIDELVVLFLGDMIEGALDHGAEREQTILVGKQFALAIHLLFQFLVRLVAVAPRVRVHGVSGNHGRLPNQRKMPTVGRESNFDGMIYSSLQAMVTAAGVKEISFDLRESSRQLIQVKDTWILLAHGDELRGGEYYVGGIKREVYNSVLRYAREGRVPDLWITGDKHVSLSLPVANGSFHVNGSFVGEDSYGQRFAPVIPSQTLLWICPQRGRTLQAEIRLDRVTVPRVSPYILPPLLAALLNPNPSLPPYHEN